MSYKKRSKTKKWIVISIITIVVGIGISMLMKPAPSYYDSVEAEIGDITTYYSFSGNVETKHRQTVMSEKVMQISEIMVADGNIIAAGDVLMKTTTGDEIISKIKGEVVNLNVEENASVMAGIKLLEIVDYNDLEIKVKVDEYDISAMEIGKEATVSIGAIDKELKGTIKNISKEGLVLNGVTFFVATIDLEQDDSLRVGMSAEVKLISAEANGIVTLPMAVIQFDDNNNPYVLIKDEKGSAITTDITIGINNSITVEVTRGVSTGDTIFFPRTATTSMGFRGPRANGIGGGDN